MSKTIRETAYDFLIARGWSRDYNARSGKYWVMSKAGKDYHYYLGSAGATRRGKTATSSVPVKLKLDQPITIEELGL